MFAQMDHTKDGVITRKGLLRAFQRFGLFPTKKQVCTCSQEREHNVSLLRLSNLSLPTCAFAYVLEFV